VTSTWLTDVDSERTLTDAVALAGGLAGAPQELQKRPSDEIAFPHVVQNKVSAPVELLGSGVDLRPTAAWTRLPSETVGRLAPNL
jgi:hypothetical protein